MSFVSSREVSAYLLGCWTGILVMSVVSWLQVRRAVKAAMEGAVRSPPGAASDPPVMYPGQQFVQPSKELGL